MSDNDGPDEPGKHDGNDESSADPIIGQAVGSRLKSLFDEFSSENVPDRFLDLIGQLEESEKADKTGDDTTSTKSADSPAQGSDKADP